jgi:hypothetical protein
MEAIESSAVNGSGCALIAAGSLMALGGFLLHPLFVVGLAAIGSGFALASAHRQISRWKWTRRAPKLLIDPQTIAETHRWTTDHRGRLAGEVGTFRAALEMTEYVDSQGAIDGPAAFTRAVLTITSPTPFASADRAFDLDLGTGAAVLLAHTPSLDGSAEAAGHKHVQVWCHGQRRTLRLVFNAESEEQLTAVVHALCEELAPRLALDTARVERLLAACAESDTDLAYLADASVLTQDKRILTHLASSHSEMNGVQLSELRAEALLAALGLEPSPEERALAESIVRAKAPTYLDVLLHISSRFGCAFALPLIEACLSGPIFQVRETLSALRNELESDAKLAESIAPLLLDQMDRREAEERAQILEELEKIATPSLEPALIERCTRSFIGALDGPARVKLLEILARVGSEAALPVLELCRTRQREEQALVDKAIAKTERRIRARLVRNDGALSIASPDRKGDLSVAEQAEGRLSPPDRS